jgi:hypothetical protein
MSTATLMGTNQVSEQDVLNVAAVPFTKTFHPIHHGDVIRSIQEAIGIVGMEVVRSEYVLAQEGMQMFGVFDLSQGTSELSWSIGIRNSMNKSMSLGITAGTRVFVCENLCFSGEFLAFRKHTSGLDIDEMAFLAYRSMRKMIPLLRSFQAWHEGLKQYEITEDEAKLLLIETITQKIIPASWFPRFYDLYFGGAYDNTLWSYHESVTNVLKDSNLLTLPKKNRLLNAILDQHIEGIHTELPSTLGDFYENRARLAVPKTTN